MSEPRVSTLVRDPKLRTLFRRLERGELTTAEPLQRRRPPPTGRAIPDAALDDLPPQVLAGIIAEVRALPRMPPKGRAAPSDARQAIIAELREALRRRDSEEGGAS